MSIDSLYIKSLREDRKFRPGGGALPRWQRRGFARGCDRSQDFSRYFNRMRPRRSPRSAAPSGCPQRPCWKRIQRLEASGIIKKRVAIVAREKVGLGVTVQVNIQSADHSPQAVEAFIEAVARCRRCWNSSGWRATPISLCASSRSMSPHYEQVYQRLTALMPLRRVSSYFELQQLKSETALPLGLAPCAPSQPKPVEESVGG